jgi:multiple sugar transport system permease protein
MRKTNWLQSLGSGIRWLIGLLICIVVMLPITWVLSISLKPPEEWVAYPPTLVPVEPTFSNYIILFQPGNPVGGIAEMVSSAEPVTRAFINSLIVVPIATAASVLIGFLASYATVRFQAGGATLPLFVLTTRMFPPVAFAVPLLVYFRMLNLIDTQLALILMYTGFTIAFSLWMMRGFIEGVPRHVEEAAILDGASPWRVLLTITLPLVRGGLAATGLFVFILNWTEFLLAQIFTSREAITIPVQVSHYVGAVGRFYGPMAALGIVASIPVVVAGYIIQRYLVTGFTFGLVRE